MAPYTEPLAEIDDQTLLLAEQAEKAMRRVARERAGIAWERYPADLHDA